MFFCWATLACGQFSIRYASDGRGESRRESDRILPEQGQTNGLNGYNSWDCQEVNGCYGYKPANGYILPIVGGPFLEPQCVPLLTDGVAAVSRFTRT
ncbi:hypothetical protein J6590_064313 [Homalodisca vitripennis]|nr:hypothetical protein J6590_064313 [Homalodisca vitripennis]